MEILQQRTLQDSAILRFENSSIKYPVIRELQFITSKQAFSHYENAIQRTKFGIVTANPNYSMFFILSAFYKLDADVNFYKWHSCLHS